MVWISARSLRRKPSWSASRIATASTSGMSSPSRRRLMPISTSNSPSRRPRTISIRSIASMSECMYRTRTFTCCTLLVRVEDRDERNLRHVEPLAQEVDADQHVELAKPQTANDLHPLARVDVGVHVPHPNLHLLQVVDRKS